MAIPKYPDILTQTNWNKNKGLFAKAAGETGLGALMQQTETLYKDVDWNKFDVNKALAGGATGAAAQEAYQDAYNEFNKKVKPFAAKVAELQNKAAVTETKFKASRTIPSSSTAHVGRVKEAAKLLAAQGLAVRGELDAFEKAAASPTVEEAVGVEWFDNLNKIKFYRNAQVLAWTTNAELGLSANDNQPNRELTDLQQAAKKEIAAAKAGLAKLTALKTKRFDRKIGIKQAAAAWREVSDTFFVMKPGVQGLVRTWSVTQTVLVGKGGKAKVDAWEKQHPQAMALHKAVERILHEEEPLMNSLDEHIDSVAR